MGLFGFGKKKKQAQNKIIFATMGQGNTIIWSSDSYESYAKEAYMENVIAFQCVNKIATAISTAPLKLMKITKAGEEGEEVLDWKYKKVFTKPNVFESWQFFIYKLICYYYIKGDTFIYKNIGQMTNWPTEFICLRPDKFSIKTNEKGYPIQYIYQDGSSKQEFDINPITGQSDILHIKSFHPLDNNFGMPQFKPASKDIDISNAGTKWNMSLLQNEARPGMIVMINGFLNDEQFNKLKDQLKEKQSGFANAGKNLVVESEGGISDVKPYSWSPQDIDFIEGGRETARRICGNLETPPQLLGIPGDNTYSNYKEARAAFWEDCIIPKLNMVLDNFNCWLFGVGDELGVGESNNQQFNLVPDLEDIPALAYKQDLKWERAKTSEGMLTIDERRKMIGYDELPNGTGKVIFISSSMLPLEQAIEEPEPLPVDNNGNPINNPISDDDYEEGDDL